MRATRAVPILSVVFTTWLLVGCGAPTVDFSTIQRPARAAELDAYDVFVGTWKWDAKVLNAKAKLWRMPYKSVGLDGTYSYGLYTMQVKDNNSLDWTMTEWADGLHLAKKIEMTGTYTRPSRTRSHRCPSGA